MRSITLLSTAAVLAGAELAEAQSVRYWDRPEGGDWNVPTNWSPSDVPDSTEETAIIRASGRYAVDFRHSMLLRSLEIANPQATVNVHAGNICHLAYLSGTTLAISGTLAINPTGENYYTEFALCTEDFSTEWSGGGTIRLNANPSNLDSARLNQLCSTYALTVAEDCSIAGTGKIICRISNRGEVVADVPGAVLSLEQSFHNDGVLRAAKGGILQLPEWLGQGTDGLITLDSRSSIDFNWNSYISDGTISNSEGGISRVTRNSTWIDVTILGSHQVDSGGSLELRGSISNDGRIEVGPSGRLEVSAGSLVGGRGAIVLLGGRFDPNWSERFEIGAEQLIAGSGGIAGKVLNHGTLSPGADEGEIGVMNLWGYSESPAELAQSSTALLSIDVAGPTSVQHDRITGNGSVIWDGTLKFRLINGYVPIVGDRFTIATHSSSVGAFADVEFPATTAGVWRVVYGRTSTVVLLTCASDLDNDADTDLSDLAILLRNFSSSDAEPIEGDVNSDRRVDVQDLALLLGAFGERCQ